MEGVQLSVDFVCQNTFLTSAIEVSVHTVIMSSYKNCSMKISRTSRIFQQFAMRPLFFSARCWWNTKLQYTVSTIQCHVQKQILEVHLHEIFFYVEWFGQRNPSWLLINVLKYFRFSLSGIWSSGAIKQNSISRPNTYKFSGCWKNMYILARRLFVDRH